MQALEKPQLDVGGVAFSGCIRHPFEHPVYANQVEALVPEGKVETVGLQDGDLWETILGEPPSHEGAPITLLLERDDPRVLGREARSDHSGARAEIERPVRGGSGQLAIEGRLTQVRKPTPLAGDDRQIEPIESVPPVLPSRHGGKERS